MNRAEFVNDTAQMNAFYHNRDTPNEADFAEAEIITQQHEQARRDSGLLINWMAAPVNNCFGELSE
ncbi:hypothetical protein CWC06_21095 [Pseudoalteromonas ruthenica]|uniref:Uncharacterized protein n=2 Tax=Pseudoalteromonas TaxID=53246 RepID=A0A5S3V291_9GAMM|nr:hypothetical protein [Pseudoalteromonas aurantia]TMO64591.1 hypothetical protein CWC19_18250 [Pseudoalteromonas aurantia]TMP13456.1 hypothetical protein CWC06_21095 [Pseudoalteromonas ruthenica]